MNNKQSISECAGFAHSGGNGIGGKAALRLLALANNPKRLREIDEAFPLLVVILKTCADGDEAVINLHDAARAVGVSHTAVKLWLKKLSERGYVTKEQAGKLGVKVWLTADIFDVQTEGGGTPPSAQDEIIEAVRALRLTVCHAMDNFLNRYSTKEAA